MTGVLTAKSPTASGRAFAVKWSDFEKWDVLTAWLKTGVRIVHSLVPLGAVVRVRWEEAMPQQIASHEVALLDRVSFGGEVFAGGRFETKMEQFIAHPGDLVVSKIRARQGSVGVIQAEHGKVSVTIHYRVLQPDPRRVDVTFAWLALRSSFCRAQFLAGTGGAMKGEISEEALLALKLPLPPFSVQRAIVERWRAAQAQIRAIKQRVKELEASIQHFVYDALGTTLPSSATPAQKLLLLQWSELDRWSYNYIAHSRAGLLGFAQSRYPIVRLGDHLVDTMNGYCIRPVAGPTLHRLLKLSALKPDGLDLIETKFVKVPDAIATRFCLYKDDLLICRSNAYEYVAKCSVVSEDCPGVLFPDIVIRVNLGPLLLPNYACTVINTPLGRSFFQLNSRRAVGGMWKIGAKDIATFPMPLPPLAVQRGLAERITAMRTEIACERATAANLAQDLAAEIEAFILGTKNVNG